MRKDGTTRHKWSQGARTLEVWCDGETLGIQVRVHPTTDNPDLLDNWIKAGIVLDEAEAVSVAASLMQQVARIKNQVRRNARAAILRP